MKISEILATYSTDKVNGHCYGDFYDDLFSKYDREAPLNILEIGTQKGGSLCAWQDYFPNATITGLDIVDVVKPEYKREGINYITCDVKDYATGQSFDIIIDDGSHFLEDVLIAVKKFKLNKGGVMVVEDVQAPDTWVAEISKIRPVEVVDLRGVNGNYDDFLIVCNS